jgi:preprotein translocase subunit SecD
MGIDPDIKKIPLEGTPEQVICTFYLDILGAIQKEGQVLSTVKPNYAFFAQYGFGGLKALKESIDAYKGAGMIANLALLLNILLIAAGLAAFQATLTLPGIAGIILTIGMAVDANVIVFERIREEIGLGKTPNAAVDAGYARATMTILDANITTLIAALVLFQFGTGPVKGFAVTLSIGILASLFTAIIVARLVFDYLVLQRRVRSLSI